MPAMRDSKGQFKKGFNGMKPVRPKSALAKKLAKRPEKTLNVVANNRSSGFGKNAAMAPDNARVNVNVGAIKRNSGSLDGLNPGVAPGNAMITKTQGNVTRGDRNTGMVSVKLSKGQKQRLAARDAGMQAGRRNKLKAKAAGSPKPMVEPSGVAAQRANNAKLLDARTMTPEQKIENYKTMHGKAPSAAAVKKLQAKAPAEKKDQSFAGGAIKPGNIQLNRAIESRVANKPKFERTSSGGKPMGSQRDGTAVSIKTGKPFDAHLLFDPQPKPKVVSQKQAAAAIAKRDAAQAKIDANPTLKKAQLEKRLESAKKNLAADRKAEAYYRGLRPGGEDHRNAQDDLANSKANMAKIEAQLEALAPGGGRQATVQAPAGGAKSLSKAEKDANLKKATELWDKAFTYPKGSPQRKKLLDEMAKYHART